MVESIPHALDSAEFALAQGRSALLEGDRLRAVRWFGRAARMTAGDPTVVMMLSSALRESEPDQALALLEDLTQRAPYVHDAWVARLAIMVALGDQVRAATDMAAMLRSFRAPPDHAFQRLASEIARLAGAQGWTGLHETGRMVISGRAGKALAARIELDGERLRGLVFRPWHNAFVCDLPNGWRSSHTLTASYHSHPLLGSGLHLARWQESHGIVEHCPGAGLVGHAWLPADPQLRPALTIQKLARDGRTNATSPVVLDPEPDAITPGQLGYRFTIPAVTFAGCTQIRVLTEAGRDLWGSPILPFAERDSARSAARALADAFRLSPGTGAPAQPDIWRPLHIVLDPAHAPAPSTGAGRRRRHRIPPCDVIIPVHNGVEDLRRCLDSLQSPLPNGTRIIVVDDGSTKATVRDWLDELAQSGRITLLRHVTQRGYPAAINTGLALSGKRASADAVLLNSDTVVPPGWLAKLSAAAHSAPDIGSVTPLSNDGSIVSSTQKTDLSSPSAAAAFDALCAAANAGSVIDIPTAVGFCMYIKRACLDEAGGFRDDVFAQGYGEENDWCLRARALGWRHAAAADTFVAHLGGRSFGPAKSFLMDRNAAILNRLHPGYDALVQDFLGRAPLRPAWRAIDQLRWRGDNDNQPAILLITHNQGGGVQRHVDERCKAFAAAGLKAFILAPAQDSTAATLRCDLTDPAGSANAIGYDMPGEITILAELLRRSRMQAVEIHHLLGHAPEIAQLAALLGIPARVYIHDYGYWCPRYNLMSAGSQYCGEPADAAVCDHCAADLGTPIQGFESVAAHRLRAAALLDQARSVVTPSRDVQARMRRHFPQIQTSVAAWQPDHAPGQPRPASHTGRIVIAGAIGPEKGFEVILACARDAARRALPLEFCIVGFTTDDARLMDTGKVFITGRYEENEAPRLIAACQGGLGFVPSVTPETWCYALSSLLDAGLDVAAFDIGTQAERIVQSKRGSVLPLGTPAFRINDFLLAQCRGTKL